MALTKTGRIPTNKSVAIPCLQEKVEARAARKFGGLDLSILKPR
jgi:hypothetical protein